MAGKFNLREALKDKKKKTVIYIGAAVFILFLLLLLPSGKKTAPKKASFSTREETSTSQEEIDQILKNLKKAKEKEGEKKIPKPEGLTLAETKNKAEVETPELKRRMEALQKEINYFKVEKQEQNLKMERLALKAKMLSVVAKIKSAEKKLEKLDEDPSNTIVVYDANTAAPVTNQQPNENIVPMGEKITIPAGTFLDGILQNEVVVNNGETAPVVVIIDKTLPNLYEKGKFLFPKGTKFVGNTLSFGTSADKLIFVFHTIVLPDGRHIPVEKEERSLIENMGTSGAKGNASSVNRHFLSILLKSGVIGLLQAGTTIATPMAGGAGFAPYFPQKGGIGFDYGKYSREMALRSALSQMFEGLRGSVSSTIQQKTTIKIKPGARVKLFVSKKIIYNI